MPRQGASPKLPRLAEDVSDGLRRREARAVVDARAPSAFSRQERLKCWPARPDPIAEECGTASVGSEVTKQGPGQDVPTVLTLPKLSTGSELMRATMLPKPRMEKVPILSMTRVVSLGSISVLARVHLSTIHRTPYTASRFRPTEARSQHCRPMVISNS